jgi:polyribonucleotide 5'-hydroxyl-kinase
MRNIALQNKICGPRVFIAGNKESGKTSICKTLVNYSLKMGWNPILADLNLTMNLITAPGCIGAAVVEEPIEGHSDNLT